MTMLETNWGIRVSDALNADPLVHRRVVVADSVISATTVEGLVVPWDKPTWVADDVRDGRPVIYREGFRRTAVDRQLFRSDDQKRSNAGRIMFRHMHSRTDGFGPLGIGREFEVRDDGLWGEFHIIEDKRSTLASLVQHGISGLSVEFRERPGADPVEPDEDGVVWRTDVLLGGVALEWAGAYPESQVIAMRAEVDGVEREQAESEQVARERAEADAAAQAAEDARVEAAAEKARKIRELDEWTVEQEKRQAELAARFK